MKYNRLTAYKIKKIMICFCEDLPASKTANLLEINRNTINNYYNDFRMKIFDYLYGLQKEKKFEGDVELDESYFGAKRIRGKRGRGAAGKTPVFGILKRDGNVYVEVVKNCSKEQLMPIIQGKILEGSTIYTDGWKAYDGLILNGYEHYRIFHSHNEFARGKNHVNGIESFWAFTKRRLAKFNGLTDDKFILHLKESEFRWNHRNDDLLAKLLIVMCASKKKKSIGK
jgi:transposase-like protein